MGKKEKAINKGKRQGYKINDSDLIDSKMGSSNRIGKLRKKQKKRIKKEKNKGDQKSKFGQNKNDQVDGGQQHEKEGSFIEVEEESDSSQLMESQELIQISSSSSQNQQELSKMDSNYGNQIDLNCEGKQDFQSLMNHSGKNSQNQAKCIQIQRMNSSQNPQSLYIYQLQKQCFYKVTALRQQKLNSTHINQYASLQIIDQNLFNYSNSSKPYTLFSLNAKLIHKHISFTKSAIFKLVHTHPKQQLAHSNSKQQPKQSLKTPLNKNMAKSSFPTQTQKLTSNINKIIRPINQQQTSELIEFLRDFDSKDQCLLASKQHLDIQETSQPFLNLDPNILNSNNSLLILGKKNSGKSTLSQYFKNTKPQSVCILDCDIGRSLTISGCVSLLTQTENINLWVGEFTPFNCIKTYVKAIKKLYQIYRQKYFSKKLVINTMGYLSGVGEMIIYEIYHLINPSQVIVTNCSQSQNSTGYDNIGNIIKNIKTGNYLNKLLTLGLENPKPNHIMQFRQKNINLNVHYFNNQHAQGKGIPFRFENLLTQKTNLKSIIELIKAIKTRQFQKATHLRLFQQDKLGNVTQISSSDENLTDMRIVLLGKWLPNIKENQENQKQKNQNHQENQNQENRQNQENQEKKNQEKQKNQQNWNSCLFNVFGIGFGFDGSVYFSKEQLENVLSRGINLKQECQNLRGLLSEGVDLEKNFYLLNQSALIDFELEYGQIPFMLPIIKGMGSKGVRNNPSKNV